MRRGTTPLVGGAAAVALAIGGLVGGVLAESPSAGTSPAAPVRSRTGRSRGRRGASRQRPSTGSRRGSASSPADAELLIAARLRISAPLARDR